MSFILYLLAGLSSGILGGMGMGGGTVMIPALTLLLGVDQRVAQCANLIAFLPMSLFALSEHKKRGYLRTKGLWIIIIPALIAAALFAVFAALLPAYMLRKLFGAFLLILAVKELINIKNSFTSRKRQNKSEEES